MKSKFKLIVVVCLLLITKTVMGQIALKLELSQKDYLQYDKVYAKVTMDNYSGTPIVFGSAEQLKGSLSFHIETPDKSVEFLIDEKITPNIENMILRPGFGATVTVPISKYYDMKTRGRYRVKAIIKHVRLPNAYQSNTMTCMVVKGITMYERKIGVPDVLNEGGQIALRKYRLVSYYNGADTVFNLVVEDEANIYAVRKVGFQTGSLVPVCEIDAFSNIHILNQVSTKIFSYLSFDYNGKLLKREIYDRVGTMRFVRTKSAMIKVQGGVIADPNSYNIVKDRTSPFEGEDTTEAPKETEEKKD